MPAPASGAGFFLSNIFCCSLQTTISGKSSSINNGSCSLALGPPTNGTVNCSQVPGRTITYYWNDMGGPSDDRDYNDAVFNVTCPSSSSGSGGSSQAASSVVLVR